MDIKKEVDPNEFEVGVIIARFQVHELHEAHREMINLVCNNHKKVIIFLGISRISDTKRNPLDFATRKTMLQVEFPNVVVLPLMDQRSDKVWSLILDSEIPIPYGYRTTLLYGSRDSFIPHYQGRYKTTELVSKTFVSGTEIRNNVSKEILAKADFRAGIIHANYARRPKTYSTVDVAIYNEHGEFLLAKKPNEKYYRFVGGFVDRTDISDERAAYREVMEETGGCHVDNITYVLSQQVDDWRYRNEEDGIMTRLFLASFGHGKPTPTDDISVLKWIPISNFKDLEYINENIMGEHRSLMINLMSNDNLKKILNDKP